MPKVKFDTAASCVCVHVNVGVIVAIVGLVVSCIAICLLLNGVSWGDQRVRVASVQWYECAEFSCDCSKVLLLFLFCFYDFCSSSSSSSSS